MPALVPAADSPETLPPRRLAELIALGDEAAAFAAAGLPLEIGLGAGTPGGLSDRVAARLRGGMGLTEAYAAERGPLPVALRAVLESGLRSGRPGEALARVAERSRFAADLRAELTAALVGPLAVIGVAAALAAWILPTVAGPLADMLRQAGAEVSAPVRWFERLEPADALWLLFVPPAVVGGFALLALWTGGRALRWVPGVRGVRTELRWAGFAHLLALLTGAGTPLGEALRLAAGTAGEVGAAGLGRAADRLDAGESRAAVFASAGSSTGSATGSRAAPPAPPLIAWTLANVPAADLPAALAAASRLHARRARSAAARCAAAWPLAATALVGGGVAALYIFGVAVPALDLLDALTRPLGPGTPR
ncbi:type II secretion system F family protein [Alienimonas californiensis]|uniref:Bacterial type II secretion system protein F domain protein n=1 Tax=Alienimonas californiensis TaxID=2527989 RepID=A0A517P975_9PLAN|nr:type II secretion system F family protein [Alienimonas californiensis]QDT15936.1 Bacterial type II secretion system protein F domain protein [Alienimonas californiensis]